MAFDSALFAALPMAQPHVPPTSVPTTKTAWRAWADQVSRAMPVATRHVHAARLAALVTTLAQSGAALVGLYSPLGAEADTRDLAHALLVEGMALAYPRVAPDGASMDFVRTPGPSALVPRPRSRLLEPEGPAVDAQLLDVVLVPALAIHPAGPRIGRGGGHFDRFLPKLRADAVAIGVCANAQVVAWSPVEPHDWPLHAVATETGLFRLG